MNILKILTISLFPFVLISCNNSEKTKVISNQMILDATDSLNIYFLNEIDSLYERSVYLTTTKIDSFILPPVKGYGLREPYLKKDEFEKVFSPFLNDTNIVEIEINVKSGNYFRLDLKDKSNSFRFWQRPLLELKDTANKQETKISYISSLRFDPYWQHTAMTDEEKAKIRKEFKKINPKANFSYSKFYHDIIYYYKCWKTENYMLEINIYYQTNDELFDRKGYEKIHFVE